GTETSTCCRLSLDKNESPEFLRRAGAEDRETVKW
ncbi:hypothetical protein LINPERPRIM_LOCUS31906, partial [Linum perenne]